MRIRDRAHLLKRRLRLTRRMHSEFFWTWWRAWQEAGLVQRHTLLILARIELDAAAVRLEQALFEQDVRRSLDRIPVIMEVQT